LADAGHLPIEANDDILLAMLDKQRTYDLAADMGVGAPRTVTAYSHDEARQGLRAGLAYPCAVKPTRSDTLLRNAPDFKNPKGSIVHDESELHDYLDGLFAAEVGALVTEIIPGDDDRYCSYYTYLDERGQPLAHFTKRKPRQYPIEFGLGTFHVTKWQPDVAEVGLRFMQGIGLRGLGYVEFKRDERDGELKVIECNPRFSMANGLAARAGVDFALLAYDRLVGRTRPPMTSFRDNVVLWFPRDDVRALRSYRARGKLTTAAWLRSLAHVPHFPTFQWSDPVPFAAGVRGALRRMRHDGPRARRAEAVADRAIP
jgi:predicted ATP-grasp superfamily ATP-dependent carboligase